MVDILLVICEVAQNLIAFYNHWLNLYGCFANIQCKNNKPEEALEALKNAFAHGKRFAEFADGTSEKPNISPFTDLLKQYTGSTDPRSEVQRVCVLLKKDKMQALMRDNDNFIALVKEVEAWLAERS